MRPTNKSRSRNKPGGNGGQQHSGNSSNNNNNQRRNIGNVINRVFESAGPDGKVRGTPQQIIEKYNALARDAQLSGDRVASESYLQHAEHYSRLLGEAQRAQDEQRFSQDRDENRRDDASEFSGDQQPQQSEMPSNQGYQPRPQQQPQPQPQQQPQHPSEARVASGLAMIEPEDVEDGGPIDTPEGRSQTVVVPLAAPAPVAQAAPEPRRSDSAHPETEPSAATPAEPASAETMTERPKRPRIRRRAKSETETAPASE